MLAGSFMRAAIALACAFNIAAKSDCSAYINAYATALANYQYASDQYRAVAGLGPLAVPYYWNMVSKLGLLAQASSQLAACTGP